MKQLVLTTCFLFCSIFAGLLYAQSSTLSVQGVLRNSNGTAVENGDYEINFKLYAEATGGTAIWEETIEQVPVEGGIYSVVLGSGSNVLDAPFDQPYFLGISIEGGTELIPRAQLTSSPYALSLIGSDNIFPNSGNVGVGDNNPQTKLSIKRGNSSIGFEADGNATRHGLISVSTNGLNYHTDGNNTAHVFSGDDGEKMRIETNGNIGIGTNNPTNKLHIAGDDEQIKIEGVNNANIGFYKTDENASEGATIGYKNSNGGDLILSNTIGPIAINPTGSLIVNQAGETIKLIGDTATYIGLYAEGESNRKGYIGFNSPMSLDLENETPDGNISVNTTGAGEVLMNTTLVITSGEDKIKTIGYHKAHTESNCCASINGFNERKVSIWADQNIRAKSFMADSDRRIKKDFKISNSKKDLALLNQIEVTDYTHIDPSISGTGIIKGFIAQQVKSVYPEAVTETKGVIPSIFEFPAYISKSGNNTTFTMTHIHELSVGDQVQIISKNEELVFTVAEVPSKYSFTINTWTGSMKKEEVFVYGKEITDFNVVDYDKVFTISVSAVQELTRKVEALKSENALLKSSNRKSAAQNRTMKADLNDLNLRLRTLENLFETTGNR